jgi:hypothetical protein
MEGYVDFFAVGLPRFDRLRIIVVRTDESFQRFSGVSPLRGLNPRLMSGIPQDVFASLS